MRPIERGPWPTYSRAARTIHYIFNDWSNAKAHLEARTGSFCHFCEMRVNNALAVEHIKPKVHFPRLSAHWENFLLICSSCNSRKRECIPESPYRKNYYWPHLHNTLLVIESPAALGVMTVKSGILPAQETKARATIDLYGLDKTKTTTGDGDNRYLERLKAIKMAIDRKIEFSKGLATTNAIVDMAETTGFFTVWLNIFNDIPQIRQALINNPAFHLPPQCFDTDLNPVNRNPANLNDPV